MTREQLLSSLKQLHELLHEERHPDAETRALLESVTSDIQSVLNPPSSESDPKQHETVTEQLRVALFEFRTRHPNLSGLIDQMTDALAGIGI
ncbi:MAG: DUF4404 family protein [Planctomyces sp.]|jgi:hypothetical protein